MLWVLMAAVLVILLFVVPKSIAVGNQPTPLPRTALLAAQALLVLFVLFSIASTSYVIIGTDEVGHLSRIYWGKSLPPGRIIALDGEKGPQAEILSPGFHSR